MHLSCIVYRFVSDDAARRTGDRMCHTDRESVRKCLQMLDESAAVGPPYFPTATMWTSRHLLSTEVPTPNVSRKGYFRSQVTCDENAHSRAPRKPFPPPSGAFNVCFLHQPCYAVATGETCGGRAWRRFGEPGFRAYANRARPGSTMRTARSTPHARDRGRVQMVRTRSAGPLRTKSHRETIRAASQTSTGGPCSV